MHEWRKDEAITACKLNASQVRPHMEHTFKSGLDTGVTDMDFTPDNVDTGTDSGWTWGVARHEDWVGNARLEWSDTCGRYKATGGMPGLTGALFKEPGCKVEYCWRPEPEWKSNPERKSPEAYMAEFNAWACSDADTDPPTWDHWEGQPGEAGPDVLQGPVYLVSQANVSICGGGRLEINTSQAAVEASGGRMPVFRVPTPDSAYYSGIAAVGGNSGQYVQMDAVLSARCAGTGAEKVLDVKNTSAMTVWPVTRPAGFRKESEMDLDQCAYMGRRIAASSWAPVVSPDPACNSPIIKAMSVGETGGTFVDVIKASGCDKYSIGIGAGVEFYGPDQEVDLAHTRPMAGAGIVNLDSGSGHNVSGFISITPIDERPWQFRVCASLNADVCGGDPGSCWDPGSSWWERQVDKMPFACHQVFMNDVPAFAWSPITCTDLGSGGTNGIVHPCVHRIKSRKQAAKTSYQLKSVKCNVNYLAGEIVCGAIGIGTARFQWPQPWTDPGSSGYSLDCCYVELNASGGLVTGIAPDSNCRPYIDEEGFIHTSNPEWMARWGVAPAHWWCEIDGTVQANPGTVCTIRPNLSCHKNRIERGNVLLAGAHWLGDDDPDGNNGAGVISAIYTDITQYTHIANGNIYIGGADYDPCGDIECNHPGVINSIGWNPPEQYPSIFMGDILLNGANYLACDSDIQDGMGGIKSIRVGEDCGIARICQGDIIVPKADSACGVLGVIVDILPGTCGWRIHDGIAEVPLAQWNNPSVEDEDGVVHGMEPGASDWYICNGMLGIASAHSACTRWGVVDGIGIVEDGCMRIEQGFISIPLADSGTGACQRYGVVGALEVGASQNGIYAGTIEVARADSSYPRWGVVQAIDTNDCRRMMINEGTISLAKADSRDCTYGVVRCIGITPQGDYGSIGQVMRIDNGAINIPTAIYYPSCFASESWKNRPGLIRGIKTAPDKLPQPYIDDCGFIWVSGR